MNSMQIKDKLKNITNNGNSDFNVVFRSYMYERFIERLASSKYKDDFILKGGYLLSLIFGLDFRHTMDIDFSLKSHDLTEDNITKIINDIINVKIDDGCIITFDSINPIRNEDEYGGYRVKITVNIENIKESFALDIATGDLITPKEIIYQHKKMLDYKYITLAAYNIETILSEKLETILSKMEFSSRLKDYYDVYLIYTIKKDEIDINNLKEAVNRTFKNRNFKGNVFEIIKLIEESTKLKQRWNIYISRFKHTSISYEELINVLKELLNIIDLK